MQVSRPKERKDTILSSRLLVVDGDIYLRGILRQQLAVEGFDNFFEVGSVADFDTTFENTNPDLILIDIQIPNGNAIEICQSLRRNGFAKPIIMLTIKGAEDDIVLGLEAGANDYLTKPFRVGELLARIRIQLRQSLAVGVAQFEIGNLIFVPANKTVHEISSDLTQILTEKETEILSYLYQAFPNEVTKTQILSEVWDFRIDVSTHTLETHIYRLRQKISLFNKKPLVLTTEKGYRLAD